MDVRQHQRFVIADRSYLNIVKRDISKLAESYGFDETGIGKINIVVSEMVSNLIKHTTDGGEILVKPTDEDLKGIEIICLDRGPGMLNPEHLMADGVSTSGTAGEGLGAIKRQSTFFDYYTQDQGGTILLSRIFKTVVHSPYQTRIIAKPEKLEIGAVMVAKTGETLCGDGWHLQLTDGKVLILAVDGLGHGPDANEAASQSIASFRNNAAYSPAETLRQIHSDIRRTRGAVGAVLHINKKSPEVQFCGIGNINGKVFSITTSKTITVTKNLISYNGILGHNIPNTVHNQLTAMNPGQLLVLHSDGVKSRWDLNKYVDLHRHDASLIAALIYRDFNRGTDDTLVIVAKSKN